MSNAARQFDDVVREHGAALARLAAVYAAEPADRDDLLQEIWVAVWQALARFRGECSLRTFVYRIGHNRGLTFRARHRRHPADELPATLPDPRPGPEAEAARSRRHELLLGAVRRLPELQRQAVTLSLEGLSHAEIAEVLGTTENNVAVRLSRGRSALRELLGGAG